MKKLLVALAIFILALLSSKLAFGQTSANQPAAKRQWYAVTESQLKPAVANEYYELRAKERIPALKKAGYKHQEFWVSVVGPAGKVYTVEPLDDLSGPDQPQTRLTKALGEEGARALAKKTAQYLETGAHTWLLRSLPDLSWTPKLDAPPKFAIVARMKIARGQQTDYLNYIRDYYLNVVKKSGALGYSLSQVVYGGDPLEYISVTYFNSFAEIEKNDPGMNSVATRAVGAEAVQKNVSRLNGVMIGYERNILRFRPELSILPK